MNKEKTYKVTLNWSSLVEAENEEEAKEEKQKCKFLLDNKIFSKIRINKDRRIKLR